MASERDTPFGSFMFHITSSEKGQGGEFSLKGKWHLFSEKYTLLPPPPPTKKWGGGAGGGGGGVCAGGRGEVGVEGAQRGVGGPM